MKAKDRIVVHNWQILPRIRIRIFQNPLIPLANGQKVMIGKSKLGPNDYSYIILESYG